MKHDPLPEFDILLYCTECRYCVGTIRGSLRELESTIRVVRKEHAVAEHGWKEHPRA